MMKNDGLTFRPDVVEQDKSAPQWKDNGGKVYIRLQNSLHTMDAALVHLIELAEQEGSGEDHRNKVADCRNAFLSHLECAVRLAQALPISSCSCKQTDTSSLFEDAIEVVIHCDTLYIKTPPLFNRNRHWSVRSQVDYYDFYGPAVDRKLCSVEGIPQFREKHINLLAVYPGDQNRIPDTDNLDSKTIVDAITRHLPGGDSWDCCSFSSASVRTDTVPPGAYFTVSRGFGRVPDFYQNMETLQALFHGEKAAEFQCLDFPQVKKRKNP